MIAGLTNHVWQSTLFAVAAGLLTVAFRKNRAKVRFWLWFSASLKFFVPFALLMSLGSHLQWAPVAQKIAAPAVSFTVVQLTQPFSDTMPLAPSARVTRDWVPMALLGVWACGFAALARIRFRAWLRIRAAVRLSTPIELPATVDAPLRRKTLHSNVGQTFSSVNPALRERRAGMTVLEPGVVGWLHPILLLPAGITERLTPPQLEAVLAHELCHVRRRDNLFAAIHMLVEAAFWFHPLVWWIGARMVEERERACDEEVLSLGSEPHVYAEAILNVCKLYVESPLVCVSGVTGSDLKKRIESIMTNHMALSLNFTKKLVLAVAGIAALAAPMMMGILNAPSSRAQSAAKFEVASIKPSKDCGEAAGNPNSKSVAKKGGGAGSASPGRLHTCGTLENLIQEAYVVYANGIANRNGGRLNRPPMSGGAAWIRTDLYVIDAKAEGAPGEGTMKGLMMRALLEDRFQLKIRREAREAPVYDMTAAKSGPKLHPFQEGTCTPRDPNLPMPPPTPDGKPCMYFFRQGKGPNLLSVEAQGTSFDNFAKLLAIAVTRPVINKTRIAGLFDFHLEFTPDDSTPFLQPGVGPDPSQPPAPSTEPPGPSIFLAMQEQLGLKLDPAKGLREFLVIDHVERPTQN